MREQKTHLILPAEVHYIEQVNLKKDLKNDIVKKFNIFCHFLQEFKLIYYKAKSHIE